uniref:EAL domain-containing protein n=1 Tax=Tepidiforma flava TaxID=3004094 RepID=UPI0035716E9D
MPIDTLKVDQAFVGRLGVDASSGPLVRAIVEMGAALGMEVVAEGIETEWQLAYLREVGCARGQGHYFAGPLTAEQLPAACRVAAPGDGMGAAVGGGLGLGSLEQAGREDEPGPPEAEAVRFEPAGIHFEDVPVRVRWAQHRLIERGAAADFEHGEVGR